MGCTTKRKSLALDKMSRSNTDLVILGEDLNKKLQSDLIYFTGLAKANGRSQEYIGLLRKEIRLGHYALRTSNCFIKTSAEEIKQKALAIKERDRKEKEQEEKAIRENNIIDSLGKKADPPKCSEPELKRVPTFRLEDEECYENRLVHFGMACEVLPSNNPMQMQFKL